MKMNSVVKSPKKLIDEINVSGNISVMSLGIYLRIRPFLTHEKGQTSMIHTENQNRTLVIQDELRQYNQPFDYVFDQENSQKQVFDQLLPEIESALKGLNVSILTYGQTGSGKTYTMFGQEGTNYLNEKKIDINQQQSPNRLVLQGDDETIIKDQHSYVINMLDNDHSAGLIPRIIHHLFSSYQDSTMSCSFLEIYNEKIFDLLKNERETIRQNLEIRESPQDGIYVEGLRELTVHSIYDCLALLKLGEGNRKVRSNMLNSKSSRSHSIFTLKLEQRLNEGKTRKTKITLCDLAGSERMSSNYDIRSEGVQELKNINLSLTVLGKVINMLSDKDQKVKSVVPYRESKLTRLLQDSLVGNTQTIMIGTISPNQSCLDETFHTIKFLERAKKIELKIVPIENPRTDQEIFSKLQKEVNNYLKQIILIKNRDVSQNDLIIRIVQLQEENQQLKVNSVGQNEVQILINENNKIKNELCRTNNVTRSQASNNSSTHQTNQSLFVNTRQNTTANYSIMKQNSPIGGGDNFKTSKFQIGKNSPQDGHIALRRIDMSYDKLTRASMGKIRDQSNQSIESAPQNTIKSQKKVQGYSLTPIQRLDNIRNFEDSRIKVPLEVDQNQNFQRPLNKYIEKQALVDRQKLKKEQARQLQRLMQYDQVMKSIEFSMIKS